MKDMRRVAATVLTATMISGILAGCGGTATRGNSSSSAALSEGKKASESTSDDAPYQIDIELLLGMPNPDLEEVEQAIDKITMDKLNCTVKFREVNIADHATQMNLLGTGGDKMDLVWCGYTTQPAQLKDSGILLGIGDLLKENAPDLMKKCGKLMDGCRIGDDIYFVPTMLYPGVQRCFMYDKDTVDTYKIDIPENITDEPESGLEKFYENVKNSDFGGYASSMGDGFSAPVGLMPDNDVESFGDTTTCSYGVLMNMDKDTKIVDLYETPEYEKTVRMIRDWHEKGYIVPDSLTNGTTLVDAISSGQIVGSIALVDVNYIGNMEKVTGKTYETIPFGDLSVSGSKMGEYGLAVTTASKNPAKVCQFLNLLYTDAELSNLMNYGIEGKHYVKQSDHIITFPDGVNFGNLGYGNQICTFGDPMLNYQRTPFTEDYYKDLKNYAIDNCTVSKAFGYTFDVSNVKTQAAAVSSVIGEYGPSLSCGVVDVDEKLPEFIQALKDAGIDDVIAENQKQFNAWLSTQQ